jgi:hypothetical protein
VVLVVYLPEEKIKMEQALVPAWHFNFVCAIPSPLHKALERLGDGLAVGAKICADGLCGCINLFSISGSFRRS